MQTCSNSQLAKGHRNSPVDCSSHFPRTRKRICAFGLLFGSLQPIKAVFPSSTEIVFLHEDSKSSRSRKK